MRSREGGASDNSGLEIRGAPNHHPNHEHNSGSISKKNNSTMLNWSSFDHHHNQRHSEYSPCSSFACPSLVFFPSVWKFRLQRHLFLPPSGLISYFHPIQTPSKVQTTPAIRNIPFPFTSKRSAPFQSWVSPTVSDLI
jgi:hypothetical protein